MLFMSHRGHIVFPLWVLIHPHRVRVHPRSQRRGRIHTNFSMPLARNSLQPPPLPLHQSSRSESDKKVRRPQRRLSTNDERHFPLSRVPQLIHASYYAKGGVALAASISPAPRHAKLSRYRRRSRNAPVAGRVYTPFPHPPHALPRPPPHRRPPLHPPPLYPLRLNCLSVPL